MGLVQVISNFASFNQVVRVQSLSLMEENFEVDKIVARRGGLNCDPLKIIL